jgi:hypothetical protein
MTVFHKVQKAMPDLTKPQGIQTRLSEAARQGHQQNHSRLSTLSVLCALTNGFGHWSSLTRTFGHTWRTQYASAYFGVYLRNIPVGAEDAPAVRFSTDGGYGSPG